MKGFSLLIAFVCLALCWMVAAPAARAHGVQAFSLGLGGNVVVRQRVRQPIFRPRATVVRQRVVAPQVQSFVVPHVQTFVAPQVYQQMYVPQAFIAPSPIYVQPQAIVVPGCSSSAAFFAY